MHHQGSAQLLFFSHLTYSRRAFNSRTVPMVDLGSFPDAIAYDVAVADTCSHLQECRFNYATNISPGWRIGSLERYNTHISTVGGVSPPSQPLRSSHPPRNVPGVAVYFYALQALRQQLTLVPMFAVLPSAADGTRSSALPKLSSQGNLIAGAVARISVGLVLNPFSVLKARYEVCLCAFLRSCNHF